MNKNFFRIFAMLLMTMLLAMPSTINAKIKLHTIGDSTMDGTYDVTTTDKRGWCMMLQSFFDKENVTVNNRGKSGASSKSFYKEAPYWPTLKTGGSNAMQAGDYLIIQFAHNDEKTSGTDGDELKAYYTSKGMTTEAAAVDYRGTTAFGTYKEYIRKYIEEAKAMGVKPIVVGAICRKYFSSDGKDITRAGRHDLGDKFNLIKDGTLLENQKVAATDDTYDYIMSAKAVAAEYDDVPFIDLTDLTAKLYVSYGDAYCTSNLFCKDDKTHPAALGATLIARTFAQAVKSQYESETDTKKKDVLKGLADYVIVSNEMTFNPSSGDMGETYAGMNLVKEFNISAFGLAADAGEFTISATEGFKVSMDKKTWNNSINVSYTGGNLITTVFVRADVAAGTMNGTLTATDGKNTKTLDLTASGKSLTGGVESTCVWSLNSSAITATSETLTGADVKLSELKINGNLATPETPAGHGKMALFTTNDGAWPAGEIDEVSTRYIEFKATVPEGKTLNLDKISLEACGWGGNGMCFKAYYATKSDFTDQVNFAEYKSMTNKAAITASVDAIKEIGEGESVYIRVYPWYNGAATGKYLALSDVTIHGMLSNAGSEQITITNAQITWPLGNKATDEVVFSDEKMPIAIQLTDFNMGSEVAKQAAQNWSGTDGITQAMLRFGNPTKTGWSNSSYDAGKAINFTFTPQTGFTFIPTKVSFKACRFGTNGGTIDVKVIGDKEEIIAKADAPTRSGDSKTLTTFVHEVSGIAATEENPFTLSLGLNGLGGEKYLGFADVIIEGTLTGSVQQTVKYNLTTSVSPEGAGTVSVDPMMASYKEGKEVKLTAAKNFGYKFQKWTVDGVDANTKGDLTIKMDKDKNVVAVFETVPVYTVDAIVKNDLDIALGSVTLTPNDHNGKYEEGSEVTVKAETSKILKFMNWEDNSTANPRTITVNKNMTVTANYEIQDFIAVFDASKAQAYDYSGDGFNADLTWDTNRDATCKVVKVSDGTGVYTNDGKTVGSAGTPVVRNRESVVLAGINGLYQNGYNTADIAWQYQFSTKDFTSAKFVGDMAAKNMADKTYKAQYSLNGTSFTDIAGATWDVTANVICPIEFALPAEAVGKDMVYVRITGTGAAQLSNSYSYEANPFLGLKYYTHSESGVGNVYILGEAITVADEIAPKLTSTIPAVNATGIPASGNVILTYDEKIQLSNKVNGFATLNGEKLEPVVSSKSVSFQYVNLQYGKTYTFTMPAGYIEDKSGNAADAVELTFTIMDRQKPVARIFDAVVDKTLTLDHGQSIAATATMPKQYRYIQDAINDAPAANAKPYLIYIKEGYYDDGNPYFNDSYGQRYDLTKPSGNAYEVINNSVNGNGTDKNDPSKKYDDCKLIYINKPNIHLIGQATDKVTIATDRMDGGDASRPEKVWYHVNAGAAVEIQKGADDALLSTLTIDNENWTKDKKEGPQALCLNTEADRLVFNELNVQSYQDDYKCSGTYNRAFWNKSRFEGSVDYIYGDCDVWFEECIQDINRKTGGYIVAPSHPKETRWGYVFNNNTIKSSMFGADCQVWLGRPWHNYPKTVFMNTKVETKTYDGYWAETMGGLPALWAVKNLTDKNGVALTEQSRSSYYAIQPEGYFAEGTYTSKVDNGDGRFKFTNANTKNSLTNEEFAEYTVQNVLAGDKSTNPSGYWNPLLLVEKTATPVVTVNGNIAQWTADDYAICYVVTVNGKPSAFVTDAQYVGNEGDMVTVQSVNENGILSAMSNTVTLNASTAVVAVMGNANGNALHSGIYTIDGIKVNAKSQRGIYIQNGMKTAK